MTRYATLVAALLVFAVGLPTVKAAHIILEDDFESYDTTAEMDAVWGAANAGDIDLDTGNPGQSMSHPGGVSGQQFFTPTPATDADPIMWQFDFLDDGVGNKRMSGALRDVGGSAAGNQAFLEMGRFNSIQNHPSAALISGYGIRHAFLGGSPAGQSGWLSFGPVNPAQETGWHRFAATIGATSITFTLDLDSNGSIDGTRVIAISGAAKMWNLARLGSPSDVSSVGGGGHFDNLVIKRGIHVPEPSTFILAGLSLLGIVFAGRRQNG